MGGSGGVQASGGCGVRAVCVGVGCMNLEHSLQSFIV